MDHLEYITWNSSKGETMEYLVVLKILLSLAALSFKIHILETIGRMSPLKAVKVVWFGYIFHQVTRGKGKYLLIRHAV
jgi:hypothetical protein